MVRSLRLRDRLVAAARGFVDGPSTGPAAIPDRLDDYPQPYPRGWYRVADADELPPGAVQSITCLGRELVAFRGLDRGQVHVLDAHCPHQGAHLGVGGVVDGDGLRCPFHAWAFDGDGQLCHVPGDQKQPRAAITSWPTREVDGMVWIWFDPAEPGTDPDYEPERQPEIDRGDLVFRGSLDWGTVDMHLVEFAENSVDFQHFGPVHGAMRVPWTTLPLPFVQVHHSARWEPDPDRPHVAWFYDDAHLEAFGRRLPRTEAAARITFFGPGGITWFEFDIPDVGRILMYQTHTPVGPLRQRVAFRWFADRDMPRALASYVVGNWVSQWRADIDIWESKVYRPKPVLSAMDGPIHQMRRWWARFE